MSPADFIEEKSPIVADNASKLLGELCPVMSEQNSELAAIEAAERNLRFDEAAVLAWQYAQKIGDPEIFILAAHLMNASEQFSFAAEVCAGMVDRGYHSAKVLRIFFTALLGSGREDRAREVLKVLGAEGWIEKLTATTGPLKTEMARIPECRAQILFANSYGRENRIFFHVQLSCCECGNVFETVFKHSIFRLQLCACSQCARPAMIVPSDLSRALRKGVETPAAGEGLKLDVELFSWANNWWRSSGNNPAIFAWGKNIFELLYFHLRYAVGDEVSRRHSNRLRENAEGS